MAGPAALRVTRGRHRNAANESLGGGGGIDGAIHRAAGAELLAACRLLGGFCRGKKMTRGFQIKARFIIHVIATRQERGGRATTDLPCVPLSQRIGSRASKGFKSLAFAFIRTGIYGFDAATAADIALNKVCDWRRHGDNRAYFPSAGPEVVRSRDEMLYVFHTARDEKLYVERWPKYFPSAGPSKPVRTTTKRSLSAIGVAPASAIGSPSKRTTTGMAAAGEQPTNDATCSSSALTDENGC